MQTTISRQTADVCDVNAPSTFNVVIVYEDFDTGTYGKKTYDNLVTFLGQDFEFQSIMWKFDILRNANLREMAAHDAAVADMVIISTHGKSDLPTDVRTWIEMWLSQKGPQNTALVVLFDRAADTPRASKIRSYLKAAARTGQMDFFSHPDEEKSSFAPLLVVEQPAATPFRPYSDNSPQPRWGINE